MEHKILQFILYQYFSFHQPEWLSPEHAAHLKAAEDAFVGHITPFWRYWDGAPKQTIADIYNQERSRSFACCIEDETVWEWLKRLGLATACNPNGA